MAHSIQFVAMEEQDVEELTPMMKRAFDEDTRIHLGREAGGPPGYDDGSFLRHWGFQPGCTSFKIYEGERLIGAILLWIHSHHENFLGNIFLDPNVENKGIGTEVWKKVETMYPDTISWSTETPIFSRRNHHFYINKCGFHCIAIKHPKDPEEGSFVLKKVMKGPLC